MEAASADSTTKRRGGGRKIWTREESRRYDACGLAAFQPTVDKCTNTYTRREEKMKKKEKKGKGTTRERVEG